jgi:hypothetical protein
LKGSYQVAALTNSDAGQQLIPLISSNLDGPLGVAVDADGNVYIADSKNQAIEQWNAAAQQLTTVVSGVGPAEWRGSGRLRQSLLLRQYGKRG